MAIGIGEITPEPGEDGSPTRWVPASEDSEAGGPDSVNPLLNEDGSCAINPDWPESRPIGVAGAGAILASDGVGGRQTAIVHERGRVRRVRLVWAQASGVDVELVRRAVQVTDSGAGMTRFRHPMLDPDGDVASAPLIRFPPQSWKVKRSPDGARASMTIEIEYVE